MKFKIVKDSFTVKNLKGYLVLFYFYVILSFMSEYAIAVPDLCKDILTPQIQKKNEVLRSNQLVISENELTTAVSERLVLVPEFKYIRDMADKMGLRVWLFGGTASSFLHYVKWDLAREKNLMELQKDRFDYDFTNIFRSTQDLDIVVDANPEVAKIFQENIVQRFPQFLGSKAKWEIRTLRHRMGEIGQPSFKEALLDDSDFNNQNTDSNSIGMIEVTKSSEPVIRDLKHWGSLHSLFLSDTLVNQISFIRSNQHFTTVRAMAGENPEILSVIRLLVKAFQYELYFSSEDIKQMSLIISQFDGSKITNSTALRRIEDTAKKLIMHAVNVEFAMTKLDELGLRQKLIAMGDKTIINSSAWWLNREPLRSRPVGQGTGRTAAELGVSVVAHATNTFFAYESITRAHSGEPNVFISREHAVGETAFYGEGFYTLSGQLGGRSTGLTIRFLVNPEAREGTDFEFTEGCIIFKNKKALRVIPESLNLGIDDLLHLADTNQEFSIDNSNLGLLEKLKRRLNATIINDELEKLMTSNSKIDQDRLVHILSAFQDSSLNKLISKEVFNSVANNIFNRVFQKSLSKSEDDLLFYIKTVFPILKTLDSSGTLKINDFFEFLNKLTNSVYLNFDFKSQLIFESLLWSPDIQQGLYLVNNLPSNEIDIVIAQMKDWARSNDSKKRKTILELNSMLSNLILKDDVAGIKNLLSRFRFFNINYRGSNDLSILQIAGFYEQRAVIDWLIESPVFDFNAKNILEFTEIEQLFLRGRAELAELIITKRPEVRAKRYAVKERNADGSPIIDFVRIEPATFIIHSDKSFDYTTITKPFEILSVQTSQKLYRQVVELLKFHLGGVYSTLDADPSSTKEDLRLVENVSYDDVSLWFKGLNELSMKDDLALQQLLKLLLPNHKLGNKYYLLSEAQWELAAQLGGIVDRDIFQGKTEEEMLKFSVFEKNIVLPTQLIGSKKPIIYNGKPIYDFFGNGSEWLSDWYDSNYYLKGLDPIGPAVGSGRVAKFKSWFQFLYKSSFSCVRISIHPEHRQNKISFRVARVIE
jgi:hypothetical protein